MIAKERTSDRFGKATRGLLTVFALFLALILVIALWLKPDPKGYGTHTQLGLWPCAFREVTGRPCPSCGMTTSFAWFVRADPAQSWRANPAGLPLASTCLLMIPWLLVSAVRGRPWPFKNLEFPLVGLSVAVVALTLISWTIRMTLGGR